MNKTGTAFSRARLSLQGAGPPGAGLHVCSTPCGAQQTQSWRLGGLMRAQGVQGQKVTDKFYYKQYILIMHD